MNLLTDDFDILLMPAYSQMLDTVRPFVMAGFALHWLHNKSKRPIGDNWQERPVASFEALQRRYHADNNVGVRLGEFSRVGGGFLHVLDLDIRKPEMVSVAWAKLRSLLPDIALETFPTVISGSGGESRHIYFITDRAFRSKKLAKSDGWEMVFDPKKGREVRKHDWEIELFGAPKQVAMPPSIHPDTGQPYRWEREFDFAGLDFGDAPTISADVLDAAGAAADPEDDFEANENRLELTEDDARDILALLPLDYWCEDRDGWRSVGMALKHEFGDAGYDLWEEFSKQSTKFDAKNQRAVWKSFKGKTKRPICMATLKAAANEARWNTDPDEFDDVDDLPKPPNYRKSNDIDALSEAENRTTRRLNRRHAVVAVRGRTLITTEREDGSVDFGTVRDIHAYYENDRVAAGDGKTEPASRKWMRDPERRTYPGGMTFAPGGCPKTTLNLWRGWAVEPDETASCSLFLSHIRQVVCDGNREYAEWVIGWLAHMVQRPEEKPGVALVLRGAKGAGKDTVADYVACMIGRRHAPTVAESDHIVGKFNARLENALLLHVQEGSWAGDRKAEGVLKYLVTSDRIEIERKGIDSINLPSVLRLFISANAEWVVPASADERRWAVFEVSEQRRGDEAYFGALRAEMNGRGPAALLHYLRNYDLSGFSVRKAPETEGLRNQKLASLRSVELWWFEILNRGAFPGEWDDGEGWESSAQTIGRDSLRRNYVEWMKGRRYDGEAVEERYFGRRLRDMLPELQDRRPAAKAGFTRTRQYEFPALEVCRAAFERWMGQAVDWDLEG